MFITNGDEIINLTMVRAVQFFRTENPMIRLNINEKQFALFRFSSDEEFLEAENEIITMLKNISDSWAIVRHSVMIRLDKLQVANAVGVELRLHMDTGMIKIVDKYAYKLLQVVADATKAIPFIEAE